MKLRLLNTIAAITTLLIGCSNPLEEFAEDMGSISLFGGIKGQIEKDWIRKCTNQTGLKSDAQFKDSTFTIINTAYSDNCQLKESLTEVSGNYTIAYRVDKDKYVASLEDYSVVVTLKTQAIVNLYNEEFICGSDRWKLNQSVNVLDNNICPEIISSSIEIPVKIRDETKLLLGESISNFLTAPTGSVGDFDENYFIEK